MNESFAAIVAFMQLFLLALWEALGAIYFGWSPLTIALCWVVGVWTLNIATASVLRTYIKLTNPTPQTDINIQSVDISEDDIG